MNKTPDSAPVGSDDLVRDHLDLSEQEFSALLDQGEAVMKRIVTPQPGKVDLRGMMYDWLDSGSFEALCPWRGAYKVAGLSVEVIGQKAEKHPTAWVFLWVIQLRISIANAAPSRPESL